MSSSLRLPLAATALGLLLVVSTRCDLLVDLDRGEVDGAVSEGCPICTNLVEGGDEEEEEEAEADAETADGEASVEDASVGGVVDGMADASDADAIESADSDTILVEGGEEREEEAEAADGEASVEDAGVGGVADGMADASADASVADAIESADSEGGE